MRAKFLFGLTMVAAVIAVVFADGTIVAQTFNPEAQANYLVQLDAATGDVLLNVSSANNFRTLWATSDSVTGTYYLFNGELLRINASNLAHIGAQKLGNSLGLIDMQYDTSLGLLLGVVMYQHKGCWVGVTNVSSSNLVPIIHFSNSLSVVGDSYAYDAFSHRYFFNTETSENLNFLMVFDIVKKNLTQIPINDSLTGVVYDPVTDKLIHFNSNNDITTTDPNTGEQKVVLPSSAFNGTNAELTASIDVKSRFYHVELINGLSPQWWLVVDIDNFTVISRTPLTCGSIIRAQFFPSKN